MRVGSLFSGIGGFDLGLERADMEIAFQVENDPYCCQVLAKHWPNVPRYGDIKTVRGDELAPVDILVGGPPCQPISVAGKRRGKDDDRWLWGEALRLVAELRPRWCLFENPTGIIGLGLDDILSALEVQGYTCGTVIIPACAVGAPHRRDRVWVVAHNGRTTLAHADESRTVRQGEDRTLPTDRGNALLANGVRTPPPVALGGNSCSDVAHATGTGLPQPGPTRLAAHTTQAGTGLESEPQRCGGRAVESGVCRVANGLPTGIHGGGVDDHQVGGAETGTTFLAESGGADVRELRSNREIGAASSRLFRPRPIRGSLRDLSCRSRPKERPQEAETTDSLQGVRQTVHALPQQEPPHLRARVLIGDRQTQRQQEVASGIAAFAWPSGPAQPQHSWEPPRLARGIPNRTKRLKALGNAVVPQIVEAIGRAILAAEEAR